jgi:hypothetical protein
MLVITNQIICIACDGAIDKLVIILIGVNQIPFVKKASNLSRDSFQKQWVTNSTFSAFSW